MMHLNISYKTICSSLMKFSMFHIIVMSLKCACSLFFCSKPRCQASWKFLGKKLDHTLNNKHAMHPIIEQKVSKGSPAPTNLVFPLPVGPIIAFKPGNIIPLKVSIRINH